MTLVLAAISQESIWLLADRRLSTRGHPPKDDGCKVMFLETTDGVAILGYAGLGATATGMQPSDWMSAVLRGRSLPLEKSLEVLAGAMQRELPRHLLKMPRDAAPAHTVIVPAFVGSEARLYTIDVLLSADRKSKGFRFQRHRPAGGRKPPPAAIGGSGALHLMRQKNWVRPLTRMVRAYDRHKLSQRAVARHLANLNDGVHLVDKSIGPRCIVAWRNRKGGAHKGGGGQEFFHLSQPDSSSMILPSISLGSDINPVIQALWDNMMKRMNWDDPDVPIFGSEPDMDAINTKFAHLPRGPDEKLR